MDREARPQFGWWVAGTIFVSAFLLFQVQPMISKMILPWFGGSPAVWTTCMLFFQVLLLAGYAYADVLVRIGSVRWQAAVHLPLLAGALFLLPVTPEAAWKPTGEEAPATAILSLLLINVGLPYFLLASTGPLLQAWFASYYHGDRSPYRLYALSNVGSLGALLTYPVLVEPNLTTGMQGAAWSWAFAGYVACSVVVLAILGRRAGEPPADREGGLAVASDSTRPTSTRGPRVGSERGEWEQMSAAVRGLRYAQWIVLPALASVLLLAVTARLSQDVAVVPFMWVVPLALYLLTFIICFERERWYSPRWVSLAAAIAILVAANVMLDNRIDELYEDLGWPIRLTAFTNNVLVESAAYLVMLFAVCMLCHGEVVRTKPDARHLTRFYLSVAAGGAAGGVFVAVICPLLFDAHYEWSLAMTGAFVLALYVAVLDAARTWFAEKRLLGVAGGLAAFAGLIVVAWAQLDSLESYHIFRTRNFYGVLSVKEHYQDDAELHGRGLYHGRILHGYQYLGEGKRLEPTTYYDRTSGVGLAFRVLADRGALRVGAVGLGTGTVAAYGRAGDEFRFYEINRDIVSIAKRYFTFLSDTPATVEVVLGDARLSLEREPPQKFDILILDAFSGDSIPAHLLTREAFAVYRRHLDAEGIIAIHTSNRYLDLTPVVLGASRHSDFATALITTANDGSLAETSSDWILASPSRQLLTQPPLQSAAVETSQVPSILWTDHFSNLFEILR